MINLPYARFRRRTCHDRTEVLTRRVGCGTQGGWLHTQIMGAERYSLSMLASPGHPLVRVGTRHC